jgi:multiple sugar transport system permease protein
MVKKKNPVRTFFFYFAIVVLCFFILVPFYFMIQVSLKADYDPDKLSYKNFTLRNYKEIFGLVSSSENEFFGDEITRKNLAPINEKISELEKITSSMETYKKYVRETLIPEKEKDFRDLVLLVADLSGITIDDEDRFVKKTLQTNSEEAKNIEENLDLYFSKNDKDSYMKLKSEINDMNSDNFISSEYKKSISMLDSYKEQKQKIINEKASEFPFLKYLKNSLVFAGISALVSLIVAVLGAYAFSRLTFRGRGAIQRSVLFVYLFGGTVIMVPLYQMAVKFGILKTPLTTALYLIMVYVIQTLPVSLYMLGNYFRTISYSIEEAAIIDGCSRMQTIFKIIIPLSAPAIVTVYIYAFMIGWNEYLFASAFLGLKSYKGLFTLPLGLTSFSGSAHAVWGRLMAASLVSAVPIIIIFSLMEKYLTAGFTAGGVKE